MNYTRVLLALIFCFSSLQSSQFYFSHVIEQLNIGSFQSDFNRVLHLAGPNKTVKDSIIQTLVSQSQCTLVRIDIAQVVATLDPSLLHSYFQQIRNSSKGILLCIDNIEALSLSSTYRNITNALWTECRACLESCQNVLIIFTAVKCRDLHPQFRFTCRCIKHPTLPQFPPVEPTPPVVLPEPVEPLPSSPTQISSSIVTPSRHRTCIKGLTAASVITGLWWLNREAPPVRIPQLPLIESTEEPQEIIPNIHHCSRTWRDRIRPYFPRILTTIALLADEVSQWNFEKLPHGTKKVSTYDYNALPQLLRNELSKNRVRLREIPDSDKAPSIFLDQYIVTGFSYNPLDKPPLDDTLLGEFCISKYFLIAHQLAHIEFNDITYVLPIRMLITFAIPLALHAYDRISRKMFNAALHRLDPAGRIHPVLQRVQSIHSDIVCSPLTQNFVAFALKAAYQRHIESRAHTRALELSEIKTHKDCKIINATLQRCAARRAKTERTLIETMHYWFESVPLCNPHTNSVPVPPEEVIEMQEISQPERRS